MAESAVSRRTNTLAILSLVAAFVASIGGPILGFIALGQIRRTGESGRALAIAGIIIGILVTAFFIFSFALPYILNGIAASSEG